MIGSVVMRQRAARRWFGVAAAIMAACVPGCDAPATPQGQSAAPAQLAAETFSTVAPRPVAPLPAAVVRS
ncbi:MAG: hypothetical protein WAP49_18065, partial [Mycobacterium sp.]